jgi:S-formylglutathione hydrolase FrmB
MGGHGGIFLTFRHPETFGACGSMSGGLDVSAIKNRFEISKRLGDTVLNKSFYDNYSVINVIEKKPLQPVSIIIDCGVDDFFIEDNRRTHAKMLALGIKHDYIERPGKHEWNYWINALPYQLMYFRQFFKTTQRK